jgi:hypothetical protein
MMYNNPMVENRSTAEFFSSRCKPCGPINTPDKINPIMPGILILRNKMGESKIINRIKVNTKTGLLNGTSSTSLR